MCFTHGIDGPTAYKETWRKARKEHWCCECRLPIRPGETYQHIWGVWEGDISIYKTCGFCCWLRERIGEEESKHGCRGSETTPSLSMLYEMAFGEAPAGRWNYGLFELEAADHA